MILDPIQIRVLGSLIEKEITTPENYPLSLNALVNACNQRSSRDPVLNLTEEEVRHALRSLEDEDLVAVEHSSRVEKYEHRIRTVLDLRRETPGELRSRSDRLYSFDGLDVVESTLARMIASPDPASGNIRPLAVMLPRQPGSRESRYIHLLGGPVDTIAPDSISTNLRPRTLSAIDPGAESANAARIGALEAEVEALHAEVAALSATVAQLNSRLNAE